MSLFPRRNDATVPVIDATDHTQAAGPVRNGHRWRVYKIDPDTNRVAARRLTDGARALFTGDYLAEHVHYGYAVTVHASQGVPPDCAPSWAATSAPTPSWQLWPPSTAPTSPPRCARCSPSATEHAPDWAPSTAPTPPPVAWPPTCPRCVTKSTSPASLAAPLHPCDRIPHPGQHP